MSEFLKTLISKMFDFLNFGRLLSMFFPGFLLAFSIAMTISLLFPPISGTGDFPPGIISSPDNVSRQFSIPLNDNNNIEIGRVIVSLKQEVPLSDNNISSFNIQTNIIKEELIKGKSPDNTYSKKEIFIWRIQFDFKRIKENFSLIMILTFPLGIFIYNISYKIIKRMENIFLEHDGKEFKIYQYNSANDEDVISKRFDFLKNEFNKVGSVYFAPFLKEKFSGEDNYYNLLLTEYYRFIEFSVTLPISLILSCFAWNAYFTTYSFFFEDPPSILYIFNILCTTIAFLNIIYIFYIAYPLTKRFCKARSHLIKGVTDYMKKGLATAKLGDKNLPKAKPGPYFYSDTPNN